MTEQKKKSIVPSNADPNFMQQLTIQLKLILRLLGDKRVSPLLKLLPIGALVYFIVPEPIPFVDDPIVLGVGTYMFIELCPPDVVAEHKKKLREEIMGAAAIEASEEIVDGVVDGEFEDLEES